MKCFVPTCKNISGVQFPADPVTKQKWLDGLGLKFATPLENSILCFDHFKQEDLIVEMTDSSCVTKVKDGAIPKSIYKGIFNLKVIGNENSDKVPQKFIIVHPSPPSTSFQVEERNDFKWSFEQTKLLIELYKRYTKMVGTMEIKTSKIMWLRIAQELKTVYSINVTDQNCVNRWRVLERNYKKYFNNRHKTGRARKFFEYTKEMEDLMSDKLNRKPELVLLTSKYNVLEDPHSNLQNRSDISEVEMKMEAHNESYDHLEEAHDIFDSVEEQEDIYAEDEPEEILTPQQELQRILVARRRKQMRKRRSLIRGLKEYRLYFKRKLELEEKRIKVKEEKNRILLQANRLMAQKNRIDEAYKNIIKNKKCNCCCSNKTND